MCFKIWTSGKWSSGFLEGWKWEWNTWNDQPKKIREMMLTVVINMALLACDCSREIRHFCCFIILYLKLLNVISNSLGLWPPPSLPLPPCFQEFKYTYFFSPGIQAPPLVIYRSPIYRTPVHIKKMIFITAFMTSTRLQCR